jgi:hypothetical protein
MARWKYVKVEVDLQDFDSEDLAEELESRGYVVVNTPETLPSDEELMLRQMYETKKLGGNIDQQLAEYFWQKLNVII